MTDCAPRCWLLAPQKFGRTSQILKLKTDLGLQRKKLTNLATLLNRNRKTAQQLWEDLLQVKSILVYLNSAGYLFHSGINPVKFS